MPAKLLMSWNIRPETETEYFEYLVHEFIPGLTKLGISEIQVWLTVYGDGDQKLASGITKTSEQMIEVLHSDDWDQLIDKLREYVLDFNQKVVPATRGFQL